MSLHHSCVRGKSCLLIMPRARAIRSRAIERVIFESAHWDKAVVRADQHGEPLSLPKRMDSPALLPWNDGSSHPAVAFFWRRATTGASNCGHRNSTVDTFAEGTTFISSCVEAHRSQRGTPRHKRSAANTVDRLTSKSRDRAIQFDVPGKWTQDVLQESDDTRKHQVI